MSLIKVNTQQKTNRYDLEDSVLLYKDLTFLEKKRILFPFLLNGQLTESNSIEFMYKVVADIVTGWENVVDENNEAVEYKPEYIAGMEPAPLFAFFGDVIGPMFKELIELKNNLVEAGSKEPDAIEFKAQIEKEIKEDSREDEIKN